MSRRRNKHTGVKLVAAFSCAAVMASGVHDHHGHWSVSVPALLTSHATPANANAALAQRLAGHLYGWYGGQWTCLDHLWEGESSFSNTADTRATGLDPANATIFAYGIPQARGHGEQYRGVTAPYPPAYQAANPPQFGGTSDTRTQIKWGLKYVAATYETPCSALAAKQASGNKGY